jgi:hypothetical protein
MFGWLLSSTLNWGYNIQEVCRLSRHLKHPEIYASIGLAPPCGFLLHGPPGCGKSLFAKAIAGVYIIVWIEYMFVFYSNLAYHWYVLLQLNWYDQFEIDYLFLDNRCVGWIWRTNSNIIQSSWGFLLFFDIIIIVHQLLSPCILFLDEIDAIAPRRETAQREMERRIVSQLITCLDGNLYIIELRSIFKNCTILNVEYQMILMIIKMMWQWLVKYSLLVQQIGRTALSWFILLLHQTVWFNQSTFVVQHCDVQVDLIEKLHYAYRMNVHEMKLSMLYAGTVIRKWT